MVYLKIVFVLLFTSVVSASSLQIDAATSFYDVLSHSEIYNDHTKSLTLADIETSPVAFSKNDKKLVGFGYAPNFTVWVRFLLENVTDTKLEKVLEYDNTITSEIYFFDGNQSEGVLEGLFHIAKERKTINPIFPITLQPHEVKTYYLKANSYTSALIVKLNLWNQSSFYEKEINHQLCLALFFGAMSVLAMYNLFLFFFTRDRSYFYYVLYIVGLIVHHVIYVGFAGIYFVNQAWMVRLIAFSPLIVAFPIGSLALFSKSFLNIPRNYPKLNKILSLYLVVFVFFLFLSMMSNALHQYRNLFFISLLIYLFAVTIYAAVKKNRQAYFVLFGWVLIVVTFVLMYLSSAGIFNIYEYVRYFVELSLVCEATIFSIALADRIKQLRKDKEIANQKVLDQQKNEKERLERKVMEKTQNLNVALAEKELLLKELNHRVKNNMQMIVSLVRLQRDEIKDEKLDDMFQTIQNRINAMSHLHELLYKQDTISHVNAYEYFTLLIDEFEESCHSNISIHFDIKAELENEHAVYCGLILNELMSNAFKYAFPNGHGDITILLEKIDNRFKLFVADNGVGYDQDVASNSLGLILVHTLVIQQLKGEIHIDAHNGVRVEIVWSSHD
ncbi:7TM diverse intracellular signaling domain-containing protein [Sulfurospirillum oryzae]|uniref:7TM diverse intracellular signaling domain-containing protein n=1 Tax=Sulfurospirillum oryzae TaxID=2976535 RepID=UPI0021E7A85B|nr:7TM diverse intracellular signaling domain-containing protein [Sulfurospirillum oryzae]